MPFFAHVRNAQKLAKDAKIMINALLAITRCSCFRKNARIIATTPISGIQSKIFAQGLASQFPSSQTMPQVFAFHNVNILYLET